MHVCLVIFFLYISADLEEIDLIVSVLSCSLQKPFLLPVSHASIAVVFLQPQQGQLL